MSKAKVEQYKIEKANRKKNQAKAKIKHRINQCIAGLIGAVIVCWAGYSFYEIYESKKPAQTYYCDTTAIDDYVSGLSD